MSLSSTWVRIFSKNNVVENLSPMESAVDWWAIMFPKEVQFLTVWLWWKFHLSFYFTLKLCKIVIVKIIKFISSKLHNLRAAEVLLNSLDFLGLQFYFPFLVILRCCRQSQIQFLLTLFLFTFSLVCVLYLPGPGSRRCVHQETPAGEWASLWRYCISSSGGGGVASSTHRFMLQYKISKKT